MLYLHFLNALCYTSMLPLIIIKLGHPRTVPLKKLPDETLRNCVTAELRICIILLLEKRLACNWQEHVYWYFFKDWSVC